MYIMQINIILIYKNVYYSSSWCISKLNFRLKKSCKKNSINKEGWL